MKSKRIKVENTKIMFQIISKMICVCAIDLEVFCSISMRTFPIKRTIFLFLFRPYFYVKLLAVNNKSFSTRFATHTKVGRNFSWYWLYFGWQCCTLFLTHGVKHFIGPRFTWGSIYGSSPMSPHNLWSLCIMWRQIISLGLWKYLNCP